MTLPFQRQPNLMLDAMQFNKPAPLPAQQVSLRDQVVSVYDAKPIGGYGVTRQFELATPSVLAGGNATITADYTVPPNRSFIIRRIEVAWTELMAQDLIIGSAIDGTPVDNLTDIAIASIGGDIDPAFIIVPSGARYTTIVKINAGAFNVNAGTMVVTLFGDFLNTERGVVGREVATK